MVIDISRNKETGEITLCMKEYADSIKEIEMIRDTKDKEELTIF